MAGAEAGIDHAIVSIGLIIQLTDEFERDARRAQFVLKIFAVAAALGIGQTDALFLAGSGIVSCQISPSRDRIAHAEDADGPVLSLRNS